MSCIFMFIFACSLRNSSLLCSSFLGSLASFVAGRGDGGGDAEADADPDADGDNDNKFEVKEPVISYYNSGLRQKKNRGIIFKLKLS